MFLSGIEVFYVVWISPDTQFSLSAQGKLMIRV